MSSQVWVDREEQGALEAEKQIPHYYHTFHRIGMVTVLAFKIGVAFSRISGRNIRLHRVNVKKVIMRMKLHLHRNRCINSYKNVLKI